MYTVISKLTSKSNNTYTMEEDWISEHGFCGTENHEFVVDGLLELNNDNTVTRTIVYASKEARDEHRASGPTLAEKSYTTEHISEG